MPSIRLTKRVIESVPFPASGQILYRDEELTGFGLRVGAQTKTFFAEGQVRRRTIRITVGRYPLVSPEEARRIAFEHLAAMARGIDPTQEKKAAEARTTTVEEAFDAFFEAKPNLSRHTVDNYRRTPNVYLNDWLRMPLHEITRNMVLSRHRKISKERGAITANCVFRHLRSVYNFVASLHDDSFPPTPSRCCQRRAHGRQSAIENMVTLHNRVSSTPTLPTLGITMAQSLSWQKLANA